MEEQEGPLRHKVKRTIGVIVAGTTGVSYYLGWAATPIEVPVGILLIMCVLILVPTGEMIQLASELIDAHRPSYNKVTRGNRREYPASPPPQREVHGPVREQTDGGQNRE